MGGRFLGMVMNVVAGRLGTTMLSQFGHVHTLNASDDKHLEIYDDLANHPGSH